MSYQKPVTTLYDEAVTALAKHNENIYSVDAEGVWMNTHFREAFPERAIQVGIAEQNLVGVSAGLASRGKIVFANTMAAFITMRACEQVKVDVAYQGFNVKLVASITGVYGAYYGTTHHGLADIAIMRAIPNMVVVVPGDSLEVKKIVNAAVEHYGPMYIRLDYVEPIYEEDYPFELGKAVTLRDGKDVTLIATGSMVKRALRAAEMLSKQGIDARVLNMHTIKPIDEKAIIEAGKETGGIVTLEEHSVVGGLGGAVAKIVTDKAPTYVKRIGFQDTFCEIIGPYNEILEQYKLLPPHIVDATVGFLKRIKK